MKIEKVEDARLYDQGSRNGRKANALQVMDNPIQFTLCFQLNDAHQ